MGSIPTVSIICQNIEPRFSSRRAGVLRRWGYLSVAEAAVPRCCQETKCPCSVRLAIPWPAVPRLRDEHPFRLLDPSRLSEEAIREAATIKGALRHGKVIDLEQVPPLDFILSGSVAVNLKGARVGKGGGFSDLEYGLLSEAGKVDRRTVVATTVHPIQILRQHLMVTAHDLPCDLIATPRAVIEVERQYERPRGILWDHLQPPQIREIPVLERMGYA